MDGGTRSYHRIGWFATQYGASTWWPTSLAICQKSYKRCNSKYCCDTNASDRSRRVCSDKLFHVSRCSGERSMGGWLDPHLYMMFSNSLELEMNSRIFGCIEVLTIPRTVQLLIFRGGVRTGEASGSRGRSAFGPGCSRRCNRRSHAGLFDDVCIRSFRVPS